MNWNDIYMHLKSYQFDVYSPSQKKGLCENPYIVLKDGGQSGLNGNKNGYSTMELILFIPIEKYSTLSEYKKEIKEAMKKLSVRPTGNETTTLIDEKVNAHTCSIEYQILKKL